MYQVRYLVPVRIHVQEGVRSAVQQCTVSSTSWVSQDACQCDGLAVPGTWYALVFGCDRCMFTPAWPVLLMHHMHHAPTNGGEIVPTTYDISSFRLVRVYTCLWWLRF